MKKKTTQNKRYMMVMTFFIVAFFVIALFLAYFYFKEGETLAKSEYNPRLVVDDTYTQRGNVYDRHGELLAYTKKEDDKYKRVFPFGSLYGSIVGYNSRIYGKTGLEKTYNEWLSGYNPNKERTNEYKMANKEVLGYDVDLTVNSEAQKKAYEMIKDYVGSVVVMNPKNGEVLAMVSNPTFDPNTLEDNWEELNKDNRGPFINRATQGKYRPGSTMKIVTTDLILQSGINQKYNDRGFEPIDNFNVRNFKFYKHGPIDLKYAFTYSVNTYYANKAMAIGRKAFENKTDKFMFNKDYSFDLEKSKPTIPYNDLYDADFAMTSFGYGKTEVNPLHMAMIASTIANDGKMMQPSIVKSVKDKNGYEVKTNKSSVLSEVTTPQNAHTIRNLMVEMVKKSDNQGAVINGITIAGKTGTVENNKGSNDVWFVGFAPAENPRIAFAFVIEDTWYAASDIVMPLGGRLVKDMLSIKNLE